MCFFCLKHVATVHHNVGPFGRANGKFPPHNPNCLVILLPTWPWIGVLSARPWESNAGCHPPPTHPCHPLTYWRRRGGHNTSTPTPNPLIRSGRRLVIPRTPDGPAAISSRRVTTDTKPSPPARHPQSPLTYLVPYPPIDFSASCHPRPAICQVNATRQFPLNLAFVWERKKVLGLGVNAHPSLSWGDSTLNTSVP